MVQHIGMTDKNAYLLNKHVHSKTLREMLQNTEMINIRQND